MQWEHEDGLRGANRRFRIAKVDDTGTQQLVNLKGLKKEAPEEVWRPMPHGFTSNPPKDSDGYMVAMGDRSDRMLYVDGGHKKHRPRKLPEGAVALYNHSGDIIRVFEQNLDVVHAKKINLQIGKGTDVSSESGSKDADNSGAKNISIVLTANSMVLTYGNSSITLADNQITLQGVNILAKGNVDLGDVGGLAVDRTDDNPATKVKAV
ncbi:hypothetical protein FNL56_13445 [Tardiphaga sp. vice304]|uniref:phage baseplate assembly protein domain-containing protein n=1 Tax=Tardiphaga sp. vice304 TaxID=2592817 RepID=UPI001161CFCE|nr:phage baseplate assembly protein [Tardiphaga sp. vice304]QDM27005.1 hypothetical protein FNL56_13445 [Tardiphaga sp. vice304]